VKLCLQKTPPRNSKAKKCSLFETPYITAHVREIGDVVARTLPYTQLPTDAPTRTRCCFGSQVSDMFMKRPLSLIRDSYMLYIQESLQTKAVPRKDHFTCLRSPAKSTFKCLILDTPL
jgi:hypothetical protein